MNRHNSRFYYKPSSQPMSSEIPPPPPPPPKGYVWRFLGRLPRGYSWAPVEK